MKKLWVRWKKAPAAGEEMATSPSPTGDIDNNPYLQSQQLWRDIYGGAEDRYNKSRRTNIVLAGLVGLSILGIIYIGSQSKFIPYVVEIMNGQVIYTGVANQSNFADSKIQLANYFIQQFIIGARSISVDGTIEKEFQKKAFALTQGAATTELAGFFKERDPYTIVQTRTISVEINYVNQLPNNAVQVGWTEVSRDSQSGEILYKNQFIGNFDYDWDKPSQSELILQNNPFGFYIKNISWTGVK